MTETPVLIVGAGPVGLTLALDLAQRGIRSTLIERKDAPQFLPKMERCNARTMEIYRRMGLAQRIRAAGLQRDIPMDVFIVTTVVEPPLLHSKYPSVAQAEAEIAACRDGSLPLEPYQLISQYTLEPLLKSILDRNKLVSVRYGCELESFTQDASGVTATLREGGGTSTLRASYMVGCDGGASRVREKLGFILEGDANLLELRQALYRCDDLFERIPIGKGRHYHVADGQATFLIVQDDTKHFTLHSVVETDADMATMFEKAVAMPVKYDMLYVGKWRQNLMVADRYTKGRVFLAGDSAHLMIPTGGLGMNTGVGDAIDLSWKLAATLEGWGGPDLLASYELERRQIGIRNVAASKFAATGRRKWRSMYRPELFQNTPEGAAAKAALIEVAKVEQPKSNEMIGAELGYRYDKSPLIWREAGDALPDHDLMHYRPTTHPGARLPNAWLDDGTPVQDHLGAGYTILKLGRTQADASPLENALKARGAPVTTLELRDANPREVYGHDLLLLRPDLHVVWRGNQAPEDPNALAALATGHRSGSGGRPHAQS